MLLLLPRLGLIRGDETGGEGVEPMMRFLDLLVYETDACDERGNVSAGGFDRAGSDLQRRLTQHGEHMGSVEAADAVALEKLGDRRVADARSFGRHGCCFPKIEQPLCAEIVLEFEDRREIAPKLFAHAVRQAIALNSEFLGDAGEFTKLDDDRGDGCEQPEAARIGARGRGHHFPIAAGASRLSSHGRGQMRPRRA